jgi:restriction endonuclease S subunit
MVEKVLQPGWNTYRFDELAINVNDRVEPGDTDLEYYVGLEHLDSDSLKIRRWGTPDDVGATKLRFRKSDIIFGRRRAYQRKLAVADFDGICSAHAMVLRAKPDVILPEFLPFFMQSDLFMNRAVEISVGSLSPTINWTTLAAQEFALPSLEEQRRVAEVLWAAERSRRQYQHAIEKSVDLWVPMVREFCGVTDRKDESAIIKDQKSVTALGWQVLKVQDICVRHRQGVQVGPFGGSVANKYFAAHGTPILKINNITDGGKLDLADLVYLDDEQASLLVERYSVLPGDVVTASQATVGRTAIVTPEASGAVISQHLIRIAVDRKKCLPEWLHACFHTPLVLRQIYSVIQGGTRAGLNSNDVRNIRIPIPPIDDQLSFNVKLESARQSTVHLKRRLEQIVFFQRRIQVDLLKVHEI